jgi:hypothetical protein
VLESDLEILADFPIRGIKTGVVGWGSFIVYYIKFTLRIKINDFSRNSTLQIFQTLPKTFKPISLIYTPKNPFHQEAHDPNVAKIISFVSLTRNFIRK